MKHVILKAYCLAMLISSLLFIFFDFQWWVPIAPNDADLRGMGLLFFHALGVARLFVDEATEMFYPKSQGG